MTWSLLSDTNIRQGFYWHQQQAHLRSYQPQERQRAAEPPKLKIHPLSSVVFMLERTKVTETCLTKKFHQISDIYLALVLPIYSLYTKNTTLL